MRKYNINKGLYLDACATTPTHPKVIRTVADIQKSAWGNPSSLHSIGIKAAIHLENCRNILADKLKASPKDIIFTSGATESINLAIKGVCQSLVPGTIVLSTVEHPAVISAVTQLIPFGWKISYWPVDSEGLIRLELIDKFLTESTKLVSITWAQSEIGTTQPVIKIAEECRRRNIIFHTDATQILPHGLLNWKQYPIDLLTASAHKLMGPKGIGLLMQSSNVYSKIGSIQGGGKQENFLRSGTEPLALIAGFVKAVDLIDNKLVIENGFPVFPDNKVKKITHKLLSKLRSCSLLKFTGHSIHRLPNHISFIASNSFNQPINARRLVSELSSKGIYISSGTACNSGSTEDSSILTSINIDKIYRQSGVRISLGSWIKSHHLNQIENIVIQSIKSFRN